MLTIQAPSGSAISGTGKDAESKDIILRCSTEIKAAQSKLLTECTAPWHVQRAQVGGKESRINFIDGDPAFDFKVSQWWVARIREGAKEVVYVLGFSNSSSLNPSQFGKSHKKSLC